LPLRIVRDANAAGLCDALQSRGDVDAVAKYIVVVNDDVADVNADAEFDSLVLRDRSILLSHTTLDLDGASRCIDRARELDQHTVAGGLYDAPSMRGDGWIDKGFS
jgi:hypothetical protein